MSETNRDLEVARRYHDRTCHTEFSVHTSGHYLDFRIQPLPFKIYEDLEPIPLQPHMMPLEAPLSFEAPPVLQDVARLLFYSAGVTRRRAFPGGDVLYFRAAACTGALYQFDLYLACGDLGEGVEAGLYHFSPHDFSLRRMRSGDWRPAVALACAHGTTAALYVLSGGTYWRNAWKYQARAYRHFGWDNGTILANLIAVAPAARVDAGFVDEALNALLGLDVEREVVFSVASMGATSLAPAAHEPPPWRGRTVPLSEEEVDYPLMREMHAASTLEDPAQVRTWRFGRLAAGAGATSTAAVGDVGATSTAADGDITTAVEAGREVTSAAADGDMTSPVEAGREVTSAAVGGKVTSAGDGTTAPSGKFRRESTVLPSPGPLTRTLHETIVKRGSTRRFARVPLDGAQLAALLEAAATRPPLDVAEALCSIYVIVNAVEGVESGAYVYDGGLRLLKAGNFRAEAAWLDLEQDLAGDAAVNIYFMADLEAVLHALGNRGYRACQLEAGMRGGAVYLASYSRGFGATGLTFFDEEVTRFFSPSAAALSPIFLVAAGHSVHSMRGPN